MRWQDLCIRLLLLSLCGLLLLHSTASVGQTERPNNTPNIPPPGCDPNGGAGTAPESCAISKPSDFTIALPWEPNILRKILTGYGDSGEHQNFCVDDRTNDYYALDLDFDLGKDVRPVAPGRVAFAGPATGGWAPYGNIVFVDHGDFQSLYAHLNSVDVSLNMWVDRNIRLGGAGKSGGWSQIHLHFALYRGAEICTGRNNTKGPCGGNAVVPEPFIGVHDYIGLLRDQCLTSSKEVQVNRVWTEDGNGNIKTTFRRGDSITYRAEKYNSSNTALLADFEWKADGPRTIAYFDGELSVRPGTNKSWSWDESIPTDAPSGTYTFRVSSSYSGQTTLRSTGFTVSGGTSSCSDQYHAEYYNNTELNGTPTYIRCEDWPIQHDWGTSGPGYGVRNDYFSARWTGRAHFSEGTYTFIARTDDGMKVWFDGMKLFDKWWPQPATEYRKTIPVSAGEHDIKVEYYEYFDRAVAQFRWEQVSGSTDQLKVKHSGKCLDVSEGSLDSGAHVIQWNCHSGSNQKWNFVPTADYILPPDGYYEIRAMHSGKCLDVMDWSQNNGTQIVQWDCHGGDNQLWSLVPVGDYFQIVNKHSGKCLDVAWASDGNGTQVIQWDCYGGDNQLWRRFTPLTIETSGNGSCPDFILPTGVGVEDVETVADLWRQPIGSPYDQDGNTIVSVRDIMLVGQRQGEICP